MRILVADTDPSILKLIHARLAVRGYEVIEKETAEEVMQYLEDENADLLLISTDIDKHGSGGLITKIREKPHLSSVPVIMMTSADHLADLVVCLERGYDDFLIKPFDSLVLQLRIALNIRRTMEKVNANALTHLPGNHAIDKVVAQKISAGEHFSVLYIDINQFKSFNDRYGFEKGDDVLRHTARILRGTVPKVVKHGDGFIGHIGGDDFIVVVHPEDEEPFARAFIEEFDRIIVTYYNDEDRKRAGIRVKNRRGKWEDFPLMSCSVAACSTLSKPYKSLGEIAQDAAQVKSFLKSQPGSAYLRDRRGEPIRQLEHAVKILAPEVAKTRGRKAPEPLGATLLGAGLITEEQLSQALKKHMESGKRLGQVLIDMKAVSSRDVGLALEKTFRVPYINLPESHPAREMLNLFTKEFMKKRRIIPMEKTAEGLRLAMCDPEDQPTLGDVERITGLKPLPCLMLENEFEDFFESFNLETLYKESVG